MYRSRLREGGEGGGKGESTAPKESIKGGGAVENWLPVRGDC